MNGSNGDTNISADAKVKRKEHTSRVLSEKAATRWLAGSEYLSCPNFSNNLPDIPCGPYFKKITALRPFADFAKYHPTSLEKNIIWEPHPGVMAGINFDPTDHESILKNGDEALSKTEKLALNPKIRKTKRLVDEEKLTWLRTPIIMGNDLYGRSNNFVDTGELEKKRTIIRNEDDRIKAGIFTDDFINDSFQKIKSKHEQMLSSPKSSDIEWILPILPSTLFTDDKSLSLMTFDIHPFEHLSSNQNNIEGILTNIRAESHKSIITSLVVPATKNNENDEVVIDDDNNTDDNNNNSKKDEITFDWVRDYRMEKKTSKQDEKGNVLFLLHLNPATNSIEFAPIPTSFDVKRLKLTESEQHIVKVCRKRNSEEMEENTTHTSGTS